MGRKPGSSPWYRPTQRLMKMNMIPFLDLRSINQCHRSELVAAFERVLDSGWYVLGQEVERFEAEYANWCGVAHAVGVGNGLDALSLVLRAWDIGPGDEVIVPSNTYIASWLAVTHVGARPIPVEPDPDSFNIDPDLIEAAISPRTRAIMPVHLYGRPAEMDAIIQIGIRYGLRVLEDAAQAHGAIYRGRRLGGHGDAVAWSFYPGKNLGALGDGGAITTNDTALANRLRQLRNYGSRVKYHNVEIGFNSRLDELQAAILNAKLPFLEDENRRRAVVAHDYLDGLADINSVLRLPNTGLNEQSAWHLFVVRSEQRDALAQRLANAGVGTVIHYPVAPHLQQAYASLGLPRGSFPVSERLHEEVLSLPIGPTQTREQTRSVIDAVVSVVASLE